MVGSPSDPEGQRSLAVRDEPAALDEYERQYMRGHGAVLYREKRPVPRWMQLALASSTLTGLGLLLTPTWFIGLLLIPSGFLLWALFSVLRFTISERAVSIQYGMFGPTIPTDAIVRAEAIDYDWKKFGGWGIRRSFGGEHMYNVPGDGGRAVRIEWIDAQGRRHITNIGTPNADAAAAALEQARRALPPAPSPKAIEE